MAQNIKTLSVSSQDLMKKLMFLLLILTSFSCSTIKIQQRNERISQRYISLTKQGYKPINPNAIILIPSGYPDDQSFFWLNK